MGKNMKINEILFSINQISDLSEKYFLDLGSLFSSLLNREDGNSIQNLQTVFSTLKNGNDKTSAEENALFNDYDSKYTPLFDELNGKISTLSELDKFIASIKEDSEQMELIALNAMVISIKSGEKGLAFSKITENLQRLAKDMFLFSDKLIEEETQLIKYINSLKEIFTNILDAQKNLSDSGNMSSKAIDDLIEGVVTPLKTIENSIDEVYPPIQKSMENLQYQDIIRQAINNVKCCLNEINDIEFSSSATDEELDTLTFNLALLEISIKVMEDISKKMANCFVDFDQNWSVVTSNLTTVETQKNTFETRFIRETSESPENLNLRLQEIISQFKKIIEQFSKYHLVQKDLYHTTQNINEKARTMYTVFGNLRPVMSRLHHVRILQQIEVSKNDAIKSVTDSVTDMDNLIQSANSALNTMEELLSSFIKETTVLLSNFNSLLDSDNTKMFQLRKTKSVFFDELQRTKAEMESIISHFQVFPIGFEQKCENVAKDLSGIQDINMELKKCREELNSKKEEYKILQKKFLEEKNLLAWVIQNSKFREIIERFTITSHKETAGKIGGFEIESGTDSGEITFF